MADIYTAIMRAADHIERYPDQFDFSRVRVPDCGTPGCALGWIGRFAGCPVGHVIESIVDFEKDTPCKRLGLRDQVTFYNRMRELTARYWAEDAATCAAGLRRYAQLYHAPAVPNWEALANEPLPPEESLA